MKNARENESVFVCVEKKILNSLCAVGVENESARNGAWRERGKVSVNEDANVADLGTKHDGDHVFPASLLGRVLSCYSHWPQDFESENDRAC
jgi:hypothetical protein